MRIASLISAGTEMLYALGLGEQMVAVSHDCDWPADCNRLPRVTRTSVNATADSAEIDQQVRALMQTGKPLYKIDTQQLVELQPDLIVTQAQCEVCAVSYHDVVYAVQNEPRLHAAQVFTLNPQSLANVFDDLASLNEDRPPAHHVDDRGPTERPSDLELLA
jgi:iron complex transport system substrate-binding protein